MEILLSGLTRCIFLFILFLVVCSSCQINREKTNNDAAQILSSVINHTKQRFVQFNPIPKPTSDSTYYINSARINRNHLILIETGLKQNDLMEGDWQILIDYFRSHIGSSAIDTIQYSLSDPNVLKLNDPNIKVEFVCLEVKQLDFDREFLKAKKATGLYQFSPVLLSRDKQMAGVILYYYCGRLCGNLEIYFLKKNMDDWNVCEFRSLGFI